MTPTRFILSLILCLCFWLLNGATTFAENPNALLTAKNDYLKIVVNHDASETGRFAIESLAGGSKSEAQPLVFGQPKPWTSYTTLWIDGEIYIFGGPSTKRGGTRVKYGQFVSQKSAGDRLLTTFRYSDLQVTQVLKFVRNPSTRVMDAVGISYEILNQGTRNHRVGLRILLDTMLGTNDGAPLRMGAASIESEQVFEGPAILDYWQAFDDLAAPRIVAEGFFVDPGLSLTKPDRVYLANWGSLADHPWDFKFERGRSFVREGESEKDTALAMSWQPQNLASNASTVLRTAYGLGGVSISPGTLSVGLTAPAEFSTGAERKYLLVGYVQNSGGYASRETEVSFDLPENMTILEGKPSVKLGDMAPGSSRQVALTVNARKVKPGPQFLQFSVRSKTLEPNRIRRKIQVLAPAKLDLQLLTPAELNEEFNPYFDATLKITNRESFEIKRIQATLLDTPSSGVARFDSPSRQVATLAAGESRTVTWKVKRKTGVGKQALSVKAQVSSALTDPVFVSSNVLFGQGSDNIYLQVLKQPGNPRFFIYLIAKNSDGVKLKNVSVQYDTSLFDLRDVLAYSPALHTISPSTLTDGKINLGDIPIQGNLLQPLLKLQFVQVKASVGTVSVYQGTERIGVITIAPPTPNESETRQK